MTVEVTQEILNGIFDIYKEVTGSLEKEYPKLDELEDFLNSGSPFDYNAGSRWSGHSKLIIEADTPNKPRKEFEPFKAYFYPNMTSDEYNDENRTQIEEAEREFEMRVEEYFASLQQKPGN